MKSKSEIGFAPTALLYRSAIEYLVRAEADASDKQIPAAQTSHAMATDITSELTRRIPQSGPFLEIAALRAEARFLQTHQLDPVRSRQLTTRAEMLRVATTCDEQIRSVYRDHPQQLRASEESREKQTIIGAVPLLCPFALRSGETSLDRP